MPVIAMEVKTAQNHPQADALRVYIFEAPGCESVQIIANLENIYSVGDIVAVALTDSVLKTARKSNLLSCEAFIPTAWRSAKLKQRSAPICRSFTVKKQLLNR